MSKSKNNVRPPNFSYEQLEILMNWLEKNLDHPYPSREDLDRMTEMTGLQRKQVHLW